MSETWSTAQAAVILREPLEEVRKALQNEPVVRNLANEGKKPSRKLGMADLVFLHALPEMRERITPQVRKEIYEGLLQVKWSSGKAPTRVRFAKDFHFDFGHHLAEVKAGVKSLEQLLKEVDASGERPVIRGTGIEAYRIAALAEGMSVEEILRDYPMLNERQVLAAKAYAEAHPKQGRPYPRITAKKAMREADFDGLEAFMRPRT